MERVVVKKDGIDSALRIIKQRGIKNGSLKKVRDLQDGYLKPFSTLEAYYHFWKNS